MATKKTVKKKARKRLTFVVGGHYRTRNGNKAEIVAKLHRIEDVPRYPFLVVHRDALLGDFYEVHCLNGRELHDTESAMDLVERIK
jgi:hypothetical protein